MEMYLYPDTPLWRAHGQLFPLWYKEDVQITTSVMHHKNTDVIGTFSVLLSSS